MSTFKINRTSWHYRMNTRSIEYYNIDRWEHEHSNFCAYWRATIFNLLLIAAVVCFAVYVLGVLVAAILSDPIVTLSILGVALTLFVLLVGGALLMARWQERRVYKDRPETAPGIVTQWYRARKAKICPLVEFDS